MTREIIETAKREGLKMADGREYNVAGADRIHVARTHVVVIDENTFPHILPLLTITGLSY